MQEIRNIKATKKNIRNFSFLISAVLILLGIYFSFKNNTLELNLLLSSIFFALSGIFFPIIIKPLYFIWMVLAILLGFVMTRIILIVLFYLIVFPTGILAKLTGVKLIDSKFRSAKDSYWIKKDLSNRKFKKIDYERQF
jgi:fatty acid desaturase|tara:strand:- start:45 stop:461 length:417 start_codon:yes stop_codon:yes gene_type:complete